MPEDKDGRVATALQMKGRIVYFYGAVLAMLFGGVALAAMFWTPGGVIGG